MGSRRGPESRRVEESGPIDEGGVEENGQQEAGSHDKALPLRSAKEGKEAFFEVFDFAETPGGEEIGFQLRGGESAQIFATGGEGKPFGAEDGIAMRATDDRPQGVDQAALTGEEEGAEQSFTGEVQFKLFDTGEFVAGEEDQFKGRVGVDFEPGLRAESDPSLEGSLQFEEGPSHKEEIEKMHQKQMMATVVTGGTAGNLSWIILA